MSAENKPTFRTRAMEFVRSIGLVLQMGFDPRTDPLWRRRGITESL